MNMDNLGFQESRVEHLTKRENLPPTHRHSNNGNLDQGEEGIQRVDSKQGENGKFDDVNLINENKLTLSIFKMCGLWTLKRTGKEYTVNEVRFTFSRLIWLLWHLVAVYASAWVKIFHKDKESITKINSYIFAAIGVFIFIIVDPVQTQILKRNLRILPKILKMVQDMEGMKLGQDSLDTTGASTVYLFMQKRREEKFKESKENQDFYCGRWLPRTITFVSVIALVSLCGIGCSKLFDWSDVTDEWKFISMMFYLVFPVITTWFCVFFIGYQRKMYMILTKLDDEIYKKKEHVKTIGEYLKNMQKISKKLCDDIYRFTFGINFLLFVVIATIAMYEFFQGTREESDVNGDIIYVFPIAVSIFHLYISCQASTDLIQGQHDKLRYKLKDIMVDLLMNDQQGQFKMVEILYKNVKDFSPVPQVFGGFKVSYQIFTAMLFFIFTYARIFYGLLYNNTNDTDGTNCNCIDADPSD